MTKSKYECEICDETVIKDTEQAVLKNECPNCGSNLIINKTLDNKEQIIKNLDNKEDPNIILKKIRNNISNMSVKYSKEKNSIRINISTPKPEELSKIIKKVLKL